MIRVDIRGIKLVDLGESGTYLDVVAAMPNVRYLGSAEPIEETYNIPLAAIESRKGYYDLGDDDLAAFDAIMREHAKGNNYLVESDDDGAFLPIQRRWGGLRSDIEVVHNDDQDTIIRRAMVVHAAKLKEFKDRDYSAFRRKTQ